MTMPAIVMMCVALVILWGGLIVAIVLLTRAKSVEPVEPDDALERLAQRDL